jgi:hypothetical protein
MELCGFDTAGTGDTAVRGVCEYGVKYLCFPQKYRISGPSECYQSRITLVSYLLSRLVSWFNSDSVLMTH